MDKTFREIDVTLTKPDTRYLLEICDSKGNTEYQITYYEYYDDWVEGPDYWLDIPYPYTVKKIYSLDTNILEDEIIKQYIDNYGTSRHKVRDTIFQQWPNESSQD